MTEHRFHYDEQLLEECVKTPLFAHVVNLAAAGSKREENLEGYVEVEQSLDANANGSGIDSDSDEPCLQLFEQHQRHYQRRPNSAATASASEVLLDAYHSEIHYERQQTVEGTFEYRIGRRLQAFVRSVQFVHQHNNNNNNNHHQQRMTTSAVVQQHRVALNRFSDLFVEDIFPFPSGGGRSNNHRRHLLHGADESEDEQNGRNSGTFDDDTWLLDQLRKDGVLMPLDNAEAIVNAAPPTQPILGIGRGSMNHLNPKKYKKIYHQSKTLVLPPESDAPLRQFQAPDVVDDMNGAILSIRPERYSSPYDDDDDNAADADANDSYHHKNNNYDDATATATASYDPDDDASVVNGSIPVDSNHPVVMVDESPVPPPLLPAEDRFAKHLNWATTDNPDGVAIVHDAVDQGSCGACWAFAATGSLEASAARRAAYGAYKAFQKRHPVPSSNRLSNLLFAPRAPRPSANGTTTAAAETIVNITTSRTNTSSSNATSSESLSLSGLTPLERQQRAAVAYAQQAETESFQRLNLSIQELVDCDTAGDQGCTGGNPLLSFYFIHRYGLTNWDKYPYVGYQERCREHLVAQPIASVKSWGIVSPNHETHMELVLRHIGPIAAGINGASPSFLAYSGGIYDNPTCKQGANHALLITGYGEEEVNGEMVRFWYARNSWGKGFGEDGYVRIKRNDGIKGSLGVCGIARSPSVALGGVLFPARGELPGDDGSLLSIMATRGPLERLCYKVGLQYNSACLSTTSWMDDHKAYSLGAVGILIGAVATYVLTYDCRRRRRRRLQRQQRQRLSSASLNGAAAAAESSPLLQQHKSSSNGAGTEYGSSNGNGNNGSAV